MPKILLVEDDPLVIRMYSSAFNFEKFDVISAANGVSGLEKVKKEKPDIVLMDVMMPEMNGMDVLEKIKSDPDTQNIPVIMLTNLSGTQDAEEAKKRGAAFYLVKSQYKPKDVVGIIKKTLGI